MMNNSMDIQTMARGSKRPRARQPEQGKGRQGDKLIVARRRDETKEAALARTSYDPAVRAVAAARYYLKPTLGDTDLNESLNALRQQVEGVKNGNLESVERTLVAQASTLDAIFGELIRRAALNMGEYLGAAEVFMRLALKAQSQCRATLETLAAIKNPPIVLARQANVTTGPQQINNGIPAPTRACAGETQTPPIQLSEVKHELCPDARAQGAARGNYPALETVGALDRAKNSGR
jgi:hypothetical protein